MDSWPNCIPNRELPPTIPVEMQWWYLPTHPIYNQPLYPTPPFWPGQISGVGYNPFQPLYDGGMFEIKVAARIHHFTLPPPPAQFSGPHRQRTSPYGSAAPYSSGGGGTNSPVRVPETLPPIERSTSSSGSPDSVPHSSDYSSMYTNPPVQELETLSSSEQFAGPRTQRTSPDQIQFQEASSAGPSQAASMMRASQRAQSCPTPPSYNLLIRETKRASSLPPERGTGSSQQRATPDSMGQAPQQSGSRGFSPQVSDSASPRSRVADSMRESVSQYSANEYVPSPQGETFGPEVRGPEPISTQKLQNILLCNGTQVVWDMSSTPLEAIDDPRILDSAILPTCTSSTKINFKAAMEPRIELLLDPLIVAAANTDRPISVLQVLEAIYNYFQENLTVAEKAGLRDDRSLRPDLYIRIFEDLSVRNDRVFNRRIDILRPTLRMFPGLHAVPNTMYEFDVYLT
ncbi:hypothetical protein BDQ17DRAFT_1427705 [Cyathus striatus]|nr:hypothetical protein BDQ17DRAFT_1427705 [Cyathus striatus]